MPTLSGGILQRWQSQGDPQGAVGLALVALVVFLEFQVGHSSMLQEVVEEAIILMMLAIL